MSRQAVVDGLVAKTRRLVDLVGDRAAFAAISNHIANKLDDFNVGEDELFEGDPDAWLLLLVGLERVGWFEGQEDVWHSAIAKNQQQETNSQIAGVVYLSRPAVRAFRIWLTTSSVRPNG